MLFSKKMRYLTIWLLLAYATFSIGKTEIGVSTQLFDQPSFISDQRENEIVKIFDALKRDVKIDFRVLILKDLGANNIFSFSSDNFEKMKIGDSTSGRGVLLVVVADKKQVRLHVSKALEAIYTDAFVGVIERSQMVPYFNRGEIGPGIEGTIELAVKRAWDSLRMNPEQIRKDDILLQSRYRSGGGGASANFKRGEGTAVVANGDAIKMEFSAQPSPQLAWKKFYELHLRKLQDFNLEIFDDRAKQMAKRYTPASLQHVANLYSNVKPTFRTNGDRSAVIFLNDPDHELAPWFFKRSNLGWQLDGAMYPEAIRFNHRNQWHFSSLNHPYTYAFKDFSFDKHGFAFYRLSKNKSGRGYLGAWLQGYRSQGQFAMVVTSITSGSPADVAGLEIGDVVVTFNGDDLKGPNDWRSRRKVTRPGEVLNLGLWRGLLKKTFRFQNPNGTIESVEPKTKNLSPPQKLNLKINLGTEPE